MSVEALLRRAFTAFNARDADAFVATVHPDIVFVPLLTAVRSEPYRGTAGMRQFLQDAHTWADGRVDIRDVQDLGDVAVLHGHITVTNEQGRYEADVVYVARIRDDLIRELATLGDVRDARATLGIAPASAVPDLVLDLPAVPANVRIARRAVRAYAESAGCADLEAVELAVTEAVTNAVLHAYVDDAAPGTVALRGQRRAGTVLVSVADEGRGLLPRPDSPGLGMGLAIMQAQAAEIAFVGPPQRARGTEVRLRFAC